jgi:hypothetical protein
MSLPGAFLPPVKLKNIPVEIPIYSLAPRRANLFFWKLRLRRREMQWTLLFLAGGLAAGSLGYSQHRLNPHEWAFLGVLSPGDENSLKAAGEVRLRAEMDLSGLTGVQWMKPEAALALFKQRGIADPATALDNLDLAACHAAWKGGLKYLLLLRLNPQGGTQWVLQCRVLNPQSRVVVASFSTEGPDPSLLVGKLRRETQLWIEKNS